MKVSWILWSIVTSTEIVVFSALTFLLWAREIDAAGAIQTTEIKLISIAVLALAFLIPAVVQVLWLTINLVMSRKYKKGIHKF
ncbi:DUF3923 family protein [Salinicoccus sesuvii]|uniref:DUF3923 family protein n=1 Tax=Salinicoccus sesuvii TaxID=868281 RepID=A0ABV7N432_9STAP